MDFASRNITAVRDIDACGQLACGRLQRICGSREIVVPYLFFKTLRAGSSWDAARNNNAPQGARGTETESRRRARRNGDKNGGIVPCAGFALVDQQAITT